MSSNQYDDFMTHGSLFSGIGGFDLAAEWAGWTNAFNCEIDPFCRKVLKYHFPYAEQYEDIRTSDFGKWRDRIDVLSGGFPCQPFSTAGKRLGTNDGRYLWPAMLDVIRSVRPRWVVGENVYGLVNWSDGLVFDTVCSDLEKAGYKVRAFVIPACAANAPHRRDRIWFVAHRADAGTEDKRRGSEPADTDGDAAHADGDRRRIGEDEQEPLAEREREADAGVAARRGLLLTPTASDGKRSLFTMEALRRHDKPRAEQSNMAEQIAHITGGGTSRLNPRFVAEMMGFPSDWTELPFLRGERPR